MVGDDTNVHLHVYSLSKATIKANKSCHLENVIVRLLLYFAAPIPCRCQAPINARSSIKEVVCSSTIKRMLEEICQNGLPAAASHVPSKAK